MGWLEDANAAFAIFPSLVKGRVRITIHSVKVGVDAITYGDADRELTCLQPAASLPAYSAHNAISNFCCLVRVANGAKIRNSSPPNLAH